MKHLQIKRRSSERAAQRPPISPAARDRAGTANSTSIQNFRDPETSSTSALSDRVKQRSENPFKAPKFVTGFVDLVTRKKSQTQK